MFVLLVVAIFLCCIVSYHTPVPTPFYFENGANFKFVTDHNSGVGEFIFNFDESDSSIPNGWVVKFQSDQIPLGYKIFNHLTNVNTAITLDKTTNFTTEVCLHFPTERPIKYVPCQNGKYIGTRKILMSTYSIPQYKYVDMWQNCNFTNYLDYFGRHVADPFTFFQDLFNNGQTWKICLGNVEPEDCETYIEVHDYTVLDRQGLNDSFSQPWLCSNSLV